MRLLTRDDGRKRNLRVLRTRGTRDTMNPHRAVNERGSAAIEAAVGVPAFLLLIGLLIYGGRTVLTHQALESAAADAARAASLARTPAQAQTNAVQAAQVSVANQHLPCHGTTVTLDTTALSKEAGQSGSVTARVSCTLSLSDLSVPGIPGSRVLSATESSPVDVYRQGATP